MTRKGIFLILSSTILFSTCSVIAKCIEIPSHQIVFIRSFTIFSVMSLLNLKINTFGDATTSLLLLLRGILGSGCSLLYYYALKHMELGNVAVIFLNTSSMACLLSCLCGNRVNSTSIASWLCMSIGALFMFRPVALFQIENSNERLMAVGACYIAIVLGGITICIVKQVARKIHYTCLITWSTLCSSLIAGCTCLLSQNYSIPSLQDTLLLIALIIASLSGQLLLNKGIQQVNVITGSFISNFDIIISYLCSTFLFNEYLYYTSYTSAMFILISAILVSIDHYKVTDPLEDMSECEPLLNDDGGKSIDTSIK